MGGLGLRRVEVGGVVVDVRVAGGVVAEVGPSIAFAAHEEVVDGHGGALLPGLHDHHVHLLAMAAARRSVRVGPPEVHDRVGLAAALRAADAGLPPDRELRAVGYHESVAGPLDRERLDEVPEGELVVHCAVGIRAHVATRILQASGRSVRNLDGGYTTWSAGVASRS